MATTHTISNADNGHYVEITENTYGATPLLTDAIFFQIVALLQTAGVIPTGNPSVSYTVVREPETITP